MFFESQASTDDLSKASLFNKFFHSVFTKTNTSIPNSLDSSVPTEHVHNYLAEISITINEVYNPLINLDPSKATGYDGIGPRILKACADCLSKPLLYLFVKSLEHCIIPADRLIHIIVPIFKSDKKNLITNYRPISLLSNISKILERIVYDKIISYVSNYISPLQFGALQGRSSLQQLLILLDHIISSNAQTDIIYLDIRKAFDSILHR